MVEREDLGVGRVPVELRGKVPPILVWVPEGGLLHLCLGMKVQVGMSGHGEEGSECRIRLDEERSSLERRGRCQEKK